MLKCFFCPNELIGDNVSEEHIILNAIGGHLTSNEIICRSCNSKYGHDCDAELASQFAFIASHLQVKRHRGEHPIFKGGKTASGVEYHLKGGSKPVIAKPTLVESVKNGTLYYHGSASTEKILLTRLQELKKKHPGFDPESAKSSFQINEEYMNEPLTIHLNIGGDLGFKSMVKTAVNYYLHLKRDKAHVEHLIPYLKGEITMKVGRMFFPKEPVYELGCEDEVIHLLHLAGDSEQGILYCFLEFFSAHTFIVRLSTNYTGVSFSNTYTWECRKGMELTKKVNLAISKEDLLKDSYLEPTDYKTIQSRLARVMEIAQQAHGKNELERIIEKYSAEIFTTEVVTEEQQREFFKKVALQVAKFQHRNLFKRKKT